MNILKEKKILIFQQRMWGINIGHFLAKKLQEEGCSLAAFTLKKSTHEFVISQKEVKYDLILSNDEIMEDPKKYLAGDNFSLKEICDELGIDSVWPIVQSLRNHVKSYKDKYYFGFKQNIPDEEIIDYIMASYKAIKFLFNEFKPDIVVAPNIIALFHIFLNLYAEKRGIKMITVVDSKIYGYYIFSHNYNDDQGSFYDRVDLLNENKAESSNKGRAIEYIKNFRENFRKAESIEEFVNPPKISVFTRIKREFYPYKQVLRWYIKGPSENYLKNTGITIDYKPPRIILRDFYCHRKNKKFMDNYKYENFGKIGKFIYFPLQVQPEAIIDVSAPFFNNQIETAKQVAMSMPGDYTLVVKEHPAMVGLRPSSYIEKIARTPNVKLIDYRISSEKILKKSDLVVSPSSTTIAEAAFLNKGVIQLGNLGTTLKLPNVFKHSDMTSLSKKIKEVLKMDFKNEEHERRLVNFVSAVYDTGFDVKYVTLWEKGKGDNMENLWNLYKNEIENNIKK